MSAIGGVYDVLYIPLLLPAPTVDSLLPPGAQRLPIPPSILAALFGTEPKDDEHLVCLQLGYQSNTGPRLLPLGLHFFEAKLEIPFLSHPHLTTTTPHHPFVLKHTVLFSTPLLVAPSKAITGLKSHTAVFRLQAGDEALGSLPKLHPDSPAHDVRYTAQGYLDARLRPLHSAGAATAGPQVETSADTLQALTTLLHAEWYGATSGRTVTRFEFARLAPSLAHTAIRKEAEVQPRRYEVHALRLHIPRFRDGRPGASDEDMESIDVAHGARAWRIRAHFRSFARNV